MGNNNKGKDTERQDEKSVDLADSHVGNLKLSNSRTLKLANKEQQTIKPLLRMIMQSCPTTKRFFYKSTYFSS